MSAASWGERLREERKRLKKTQEDFAHLTGVSRPSQVGYEKGDGNPPGGYWQQAANLGVDVNYVFTGKRSGNLTMSGTHTAREHPAEYSNGGDEELLRALEVATQGIKALGQALELASQVVRKRRGK